MTAAFSRALPFGATLIGDGAVFEDEEIQATRAGIGTRDAKHIRGRS